MDTEELAQKTGADAVLLSELIFLQGFDLTKLSIFLTLHPLSRAFVEISGIFRDGQGGL